MIWDKAEAIAIEHYLWCREEGMTLYGIVKDTQAALAAKGIEEPGPSPICPDEVILWLARIWDCYT